MSAHLVMCIIAGTEHHAVALDAAHVAGLQVADHNHIAVLEATNA
jgi:hypothetical protein